MRESRFSVKFCLICSSEDGNRTSFQNIGVLMNPDSKSKIIVSSKGKVRGI